MKGTTAMKTILRLIGAATLLMLLITGTMVAASGKPSAEMQKKEKIKSSGWIGIMIQDVNEKISKKEKLDSEEGAFVQEVVDDSPADSAGLQEGDVIVLFNGKKVVDADDLMKLVGRTPPGTKVDLVAIRDGLKKTIPLTVGRKKTARHHGFGEIPNIPDINVVFGNHVLGLQLLTLHEQLGEYFDAPNNEGVLVEEVNPESPAEKAGFKAGDIITRVGKRNVDAVEKVRKELRRYDEGDKVDFEILRKGIKKTLSVEMDEDQDARQQFFFRKPHMRKFRTNPFDDANMQFEGRDFPSPAGAQRIFMKTIKVHQGIPCEAQTQEQDCAPSCTEPELF
ncbi:MAG: PDZ domain-containing protein [Ignavibacteriae bacterium]|nr:MAG: PDZ domain-containing protein [Ignavibacteriota bacterium]